MSRIMQAWEQVLRDAVTSDYDEQEMALFQIGLVLQRHNPHITPETDMQEAALSRELLRLSLNEQRQRDAVDYLAALAARHPKRADSLIFAMSNAQPLVLVPALVTLLSDVHQKLSSKAMYQAVTALDMAFKQDETPVRTADNLLPLLDEWAENSDTLLADKAAFLADKLEDPSDSDTIDEGND